MPYADTMLEFHEGRTKTKPGLDAKRAWLPITSGLRDWRSEMPTEDLERFEAAAGDLLDELGYERLPQPGTASPRTRHRDPRLPGTGDAVPNGLSAAQALVERGPEVYHLRYGG